MEVWKQTVGGNDVELSVIEDAEDILLDDLKVLFPIYPF